MRSKSFLAVVLGFAAAAGAAPAPGNLVVRNEVLREVETIAADGTRLLQVKPAGTVLPGHEVIYLTTIQNTGKQPAENVVVDNPIPEHTHFKANSTFGAKSRIEVSVDGGKFFGSLEALQVAAADGKLRQAKPGDVTNLRFIMTEPVPPGAERRVGFRAVLR
jgi:uncharacterized repeat protein (TIGR01451 family)